MKKIIATTTALVFALGLSSAALAQATADKPVTPAADQPKVMEKAPAAKAEGLTPATAPAKETKMEKKELHKTEKNQKGKPDKGHEQGAAKSGKSETKSQPDTGGEKKMEQGAPKVEKK